jgi:hypothetical protein
MLDRCHQALLTVTLRADAAPIALLAFGFRGALITAERPRVAYFGETDRQSGMRRALSHQLLLNRPFSASTYH